MELSPFVYLYSIALGNSFKLLQFSFYCETQTREFDCRSGARANNYHYYTQPVDAETLAAAAKHVRTTREHHKQVNFLLMKEKNLKVSIV